MKSNRFNRLRALAVVTAIGALSAPMAKADLIADAETAIEGWATAIPAVLVAAFAIPVAVKAFRMAKRLLGSV